MHGRAFRKTAKNNPVDAGFGEARDGPNRNSCRAVWRKAVSAGGDRAKRDRTQPMLVCDRDGAAVAGGELVLLAALAAPPDRTNSVNDKTRVQIVSGCDFGVAR